MTASSSVAMVGVVGGAGTTRLSVECGATLARAGYDTVVLDADYTTQGLARYLDGEIDVDLTAVVTGDGSVHEALTEFDLGSDLPGTLSLCPARAPFERLARAKTAPAAEAFAGVLRELEQQVDHVLIDTPPIAENQAVAAVTAADRIALVAPDSARGADAIQRTTERLADVGTAADTTILNWSSGTPTIPADAHVPIGPRTPAPVCTTDVDTTFAPAVAQATEHVLDSTLELEFPDPSVIDRVRLRG